MVDQIGLGYKLNRHGSVILNDDNDEARRMVELCYRTRKTLVNPIIDWEEEDVWEYLNSNGIEHCCLYDQGMRRIGCIGCPMNTAAAAELERYQKYKENYIRAFDRMITERMKKSAPFNLSWKTGADVMRWWLKQDEETDEALEKLEDEMYINQQD